MLNSPKVTIFLSLFALFLAGVFVFAGPVRLPGDNRGYQPTQPIAFSHKLHAGDMGVSCFYCHTSVERGRQATVPASGTCMNCHEFVKKLDENGKMSKEIKKIYTALALDEYAQPDPTLTPKPIEWIKVHDLPDFVRFNHTPHIAAGVECFSCHGAIQEQEKVKQSKHFFMGMCINCHRAANEEGINGKKEINKRKINARLGCSTCHY